jgi:UDP-glucose 4-epimerase
LSVLAWVVGSGGLLGSHVRRAVQARTGFAPWGREPATLPWRDAAALSSRFRELTRALVDAADLGGHEGWSVFWCAGAGVVGTAESELEEEARTWASFLACLGGALAPRSARTPPGRVFLASSAGGVYGQGGAGPATEDSPCRPISRYGRTKLRQEAALLEWASHHPPTSTLVARISNLYGPGQKLEKSQGLVSHMSRCLIHRLPVHVYVPLDTIRDYLYAGDAAEAIVRWVERLGREACEAGGPRRVLKICAAEEETSIAALIGVFRRIARRRTRVVAGVHPSQGEQPSRLWLRSRRWTDEPRTARTSLLEGVAALHRHHLALYQAGRLPSPPLSSATPAA